MRPLLAIAVNTFRENLRDKVLYNLVLFAVLMTGSSVLLSRLSLGEIERLILDLGLACINLFGVFIAIFIGIGLVSKDIANKKVYTLLSKPIGRSQFLLGKYLGLCLTLLVNTVIMVAGFLFVLHWMSLPIPVVLWQALAFIYVELMILMAVALACSTFTGPALDAIVTLASYVVGHVCGDLKGLGGKLNGTSRPVIDMLYYAMPNLERFNLKGQVIYNTAPDPYDLALILVYGLLYTAVLLLMASAIFHRRDFQ